ncbi:exonuclease SbcCD subunit D [Bradyrhizobium sp. CCGUVB1N3]|uniref:metallophosphoesterase family protein n=1 Tax=Bradyrhizobium sp. CCGUVB1N3 TaxID=2949629 RepID=UPI003531A638
MIRILHTADWHIGQTLRGFFREHEHRKVFERLEEIVVERDVDALVIAGDVFDSQNPSGEAQQLFYNTLVRLSRAHPRMANRHGERRLEVKREGGSDGSVEDVASRRLQVGAVEGALFGIEAAPIQHRPDPADAISLGSSES